MSDEQCTHTLLFEKEHLDIYPAQVGLRIVRFIKDHEGWDIRVAQALHGSQKTLIATRQHADDVVHGANLENKCFDCDDGAQPCYMNCGRSST
jgi:hypothetical protein